MLGLPVDYDRLNVTNENIVYVEEVIRKPPINSSKYYLLYTYVYITY
jgi:hypothetical protein